MIRRTARRGAFAGRDFYGCAAYATSGCLGKIDIGSAANPGIPPAAGATVQAIFEARRARERLRRRAILPAFVGIVVIGMAAEWLLLWGISPVIAAVALLVTLGLAYRVYGDLPDDVLRWERGAAGEQSTAEHLADLERLGFITLANRWATGLHGDIDAIVVGPAGVYVVETKTTRAEVEVIGERILTGSHAQDWLDQVTKEAMAVQIGLRELLDPLHLTVAPILCVHGRGPGIGRTVAGVPVLSGAGLVTKLSGTTRVLADPDVQQLARAIDQRFLRHRP
jgi:Holliday junction resolvase-like predicted endonuclease